MFPPAVRVTTDPQEARLRRRVLGSAGIRHCWLLFVAPTRIDVVPSNNEMHIIPIGHAVSTVPPDQPLRLSIHAGEILCTPILVFVPSSDVKVVFGGG